MPYQKVYNHSIFAVTGNKVALSKQICFSISWTVKQIIDKHGGLAHNL